MSQSFQPATFAKRALPALLRGEPVGAGAEASAWAPQLGGLVVTLRDPAGQVRGSVGTSAPEGDAGRLLLELTSLACTQDPRFPPATPQEAEALRVEVWELAPPRALERLEDFGPTDALWVRRGIASGLFVPDLYVGSAWEPLSYLTQACRRAGIDAYDPLHPSVEKRALSATLHVSD